MLFSGPPKELSTCERTGVRVKADKSCDFQKLDSFLAPLTAIDPFQIYCY